MSETTDLAGFRALFPALERHVYLNTAVSPPGARPVLQALREALRAWESGEFSWQSWEREAHGTRPLFAKLVGTDERNVALVASVAEAASTVAASLPKGRVVVGEHEFQSNLLPWVALERRGFELRMIAATDDVITTDQLVAAIDDGTILVAVSEVQSSTGYRVDLGAITQRAHGVGARVFVNLTQALGALRFDPAVEADYVAAHGYKWLLGVRGSAWLAVRPDRLDEMQPLIPNWHSFEDPYADYYGIEELAPDARRLDTSYSWLPWVGSRAALEILAGLDAATIEERAVSLAATFREQAAGQGFRLVAAERPSQIVALDVDDPSALKERLAASRVIVSVRGGRLRLGFHGYNEESDLEAALRALGRAEARSPS